MVCIFVKIIYSIMFNGKFKVMDEKCYIIVILSIFGENVIL